MKSTWTLNENSTGDLIVEVNKEAWATAQEKALENLTKDLEVKGFRKGQVPANVAKKHINGQQVLLDAVNEVANDAFVAGMVEHTLEPVAQPQLDINAMTETDLTLKFLVTIKPEVTLGDYKGITVEAEDITVTEEEVMETLTAMQEQNAELVLKEDGTVVDGDTVIMDFEGFKDGVAFEGGQGENYELVIGSNSFIPGFEDAMIGLAVGEEKDLDITFPDTYHVEDLKGQPVVFKVKVHEIKEKQLPELNDDFVELLDEEFENLEALKASIKEDLEESKKQAEEDRVNELLITTVADNATIEVPETMVEEELNQMFQEFEQRLAQQGMNFELYSQILGQSEEDIKGQMKEDAMMRIRTRLTLEKIAEVEELKIEETEIEEEYAKISEMYGMEVEQIKQIASEDAISYDILLRKAIELIQEARA
ncbi:trigger factor [Erysipelothrix urinaevulpis]|uniref:trigger factor n=1 Tax=Erysipelothrix urinaevulpis TaxID=2683717 RepID=UPI00135C02E9|nr:trigger factor [Erysipelothrix urinaevulpis]